MSQSRAELIDFAFASLLADLVNHNASPEKVIAISKALRAMCDVEDQYLFSLAVKQSLFRDSEEARTGCGEDE